MVLESIKMPKNQLRSIWFNVAHTIQPPQMTVLLHQKHIQWHHVIASVVEYTKLFTMVKKEVNGFGINQNAQKSIEIHLFNVAHTIQQPQMTVLLHQKPIQWQHIIASAEDT